MMSNRLSYIDTAKGILILGLCIIHIDTVCGLCKCNNNTFTLLSNVCRWTFVQFFMQFFFIISGKFSNFNKDFKSFITSNTLSLILPGAILYMFGDFNWFIPSMYISKIAVWGANKKQIKPIVCVVFFLTMCFVGCLINNKTFFIPNLSLYLSSPLFVYIGYWSKKIDINNKLITMMSILYSLLIGVCFLLDLDVPPKQTATYNFGAGLFPLHLLLAISGSIMMLGIGKITQKSSFLEYCGKNSIVIFLVHFYPLQSIMFRLRHYINDASDNTSLSLLLYASIIIITVSFSLITTKFLTTKYTKWILGRW